MNKIFSFSAFFKGCVIFHLIVGICQKQKTKKKNKTNKWRQDKKYTNVSVYIYIHELK